ncbi:MAG: hypothetical protein JW837_09970 [Sedimentisphaerales bacterium]|nr:hypothetical protein [Sedimentisphaerales bacterium]
MTDNISAITVFAIGPVIIMIFYAFIVCLVIICLIRIARYFRNAGNEQRLIRLELGKVAEEVHLLRQEIKDDKEKTSSN